MDNGQLSLGLRIFRNTREARIIQIEDIIWRAQIPLPISEIGNRAGLKKTPYLIGILRDLVASGTVISYKSHTPTGSPIWLFEPATSDTYGNGPFVEPREQRDPVGNDDYETLPF